MVARRSAQIQIDDLVQRLRRGGELRRIVAQAAAGDRLELHADAVHRREHVRLRQLDADVDPPDARPREEVALVVGPREQLRHPALERQLQARDLLLAAGDDRPRGRVPLQRFVEVVCEAGEVRLGDGADSTQHLGRAIVETHVALDHLEEPRPAHGKLFITPCLYSCSSRGRISVGSRGPAPAIPMSAGPRACHGGMPISTRKIFISGVRAPASSRTTSG
jgi:hypothetical protein